MGLAAQPGCQRAVPLWTAEWLHCERVTTPEGSSQPSRMSAAFVNTLRRNSIVAAPIWAAAAMLEQVPAWIADYNAVAPHSALGYQSPQQYRSSLVAVGPNG